MNASDAVFPNGQPTGASISIPDANETPCGAGDLMPQRIQISGLTHQSTPDLLQIRSGNGLVSNEIPMP